MPNRILVVDDEPSIVASVRALLAGCGYEVITATTGRGALQAVERDSPDLIVLDLGLPDLSGVEVCEMVRAERGTSIIVLSARGAESDKVLALDSGADDYITKPFGSQELLARIRVVMRRMEAIASPAGQVKCGDILLDRDRHQVFCRDVEIRLTPKEFALLNVFTQHPGRVLTHRAILKALWGAHAVDQPEHLRVLVAALRKKLEPNPARPQYLVTEPWVGYRLLDTKQE